MIEVTVTAHGPAFIQDVDGLEGQVSGHSTVVNIDDGDVRTFRVTRRAWDSRVRDQLVRLSQMRVPLNDGLTVAGRTRPLLTYTVNPVPGQRPRVYQIDGAINLDLSTPAAVTLKGANLIPGEKATAEVGTGTGRLTLTAVRKGPGGNKVKVVLLAGSGAGSVVTTVSEEGDVVITVTPTVAQRADLIDAQIDANALGALFVLPSNGGSGKVRCPQVIQLTGGDDAGVATRFFKSTSAASWLQLSANKPGNDGNDISLSILPEDAVDSVVVTGNAIVVTPATGAIGVDDIAAQINAEPTAAAIATAVAVGASNLSPAEFGPKYLYGGGGETPVATIGGAPATITSHTDTAIVMSVTNAALVSAGVAASETAVVNVLTGYAHPIALPLPVVA